MAGQGTATIELLDQVADLDTILCPIGGGGLISGTAVAALGIKPGIRVIGAEPAGADDASRSFQAGTRIPLTQANTIADGLRGSLSDRTFAEIRSHVADVVTVSEESIVAAMRAIWEVLKIVDRALGCGVVRGDRREQGRRAGPPRRHHPDRRQSRPRQAALDTT